MQNSAPSPKSVREIFGRSWQIYRTYFVGLWAISFICLLPVFILEFTQTQISAEPNSQEAVGALLSLLPHILYSLVIRIIEASITIGMIVLLFKEEFPSLAIMQLTVRGYLAASLHVGFLQFLIVNMGAIGLRSAFPMNLVLLMLLIASFYFISLAQVCLVIEGQKGFLALLTSTKFIRNNLSKSFWVITLFMLIEYSALGLFFQIFSAGHWVDLQKDNQDLTEMMTTFLKSPEMVQALLLAKYLATFLIHPFASLMLVLLYFDCNRLNLPSAKMFYQRVAPIVPMTEELKKTIEEEEQRAKPSRPQTYSRGPEASPPMSEKPKSQAETTTMSNSELNRSEQVNTSSSAPSNLSESKPISEDDPNYEPPKDKLN